MVITSTSVPTAVVVGTDLHLGSTSARVTKHLTSSSSSSSFSRTVVGISTASASLVDDGEPGGEGGAILLRRAVVHEVEDILG